MRGPDTPDPPPLPAVVDVTPQAITDARAKAVWGEPLPPVPATRLGRLRDELLVRSLWPPVAGRATRDAAWFRVAGVGASVHVADSALGRLVARTGATQHFHTAGPLRWRLLGPDLTRPADAARYVLGGERP